MKHYFFSTNFEALLNQFSVKKENLKVLRKRDAPTIKVYKLYEMEFPRKVKQVEIEISCTK